MKFFIQLNLFMCIFCLILSIAFAFPFGFYVKKQNLILLDSAKISVISTPRAGSHLQVESPLGEKYWIYCNGMEKNICSMGNRGAVFESKKVQLIVNSEKTFNHIYGIMLKYTYNNIEYINTQFDPEVNLNEIFLSHTFFSIKLSMVFFIISLLCFVIRKV